MEAAVKLTSPMLKLQCPSHFQLLCKRERESHLHFPPPSIRSFPPLTETASPGSISVHHSGRSVESRNSSSTNTELLRGKRNIRKEKAQAGSVPEEVILHVNPWLQGPNESGIVRPRSRGCHLQSVRGERRIGFIQYARTLAPFQPGPGEVRRRARDNWPGIAARPPPRVRTMFSSAERLNRRVYRDVLQPGNVRYRRFQDLRPSASGWRLPSGSRKAARCGRVLLSSSHPIAQGHNSVAVYRACFCPAKVLVARAYRDVSRKQFFAIVSAE